MELAEFSVLLLERQILAVVKNIEKYWSLNFAYKVLFCWIC